MQHKKIMVASEVIKRPGIIVLLGTASVKRVGYHGSVHGCNYIFR
jgi:hypothetical protein